ncbi:MAG: hypothetical protein P1U68_09075 [Verrucomicrobiales bacterium]|nr:hypothetical protein [Verrucomicrobiales bacterium]
MNRATTGPTTAVKRTETVVLLHGLARTTNSMKRMEDALTHAGYRVVNIGYLSRQFPVEALAEKVLGEIRNRIKKTDRVHFVTHSLGGIIVRYLHGHLSFDQIDRVVMLCPPNKGSEIVDHLGGLKLFEWLNGPAGLQLGTSPTGFISELGPVNFELGVITGDRSINWLLSTLIPGKNDGKVSLESARISGMTDYKVVHATHPYIMRKKEVIRDVLTFLETGRFSD